jgi:REP element-mobilizing transposase RayT
MNYRRLFIPNSIVFITVVTFDRKEILIPNIELLKNAIKQTKQKYQFDIVVCRLGFQPNNNFWVQFCAIGCKNSAKNE